MKKGGKCVGSNIAPNTVHRLKKIAWKTLGPIHVVGAQIGNSITHSQIVGAKEWASFGKNDAPPYEVCLTN